MRKRRRNPAVLTPVDSSTGRRHRWDMAKVVGLTRAPAGWRIAWRRVRVGGVEYELKPRACGLGCRCDATATRVGRRNPEVRVRHGGPQVGLRMRYAEGQIVSARYYDPEERRRVHGAARISQIIQGRQPKYVLDFYGNLEPEGVVASKGDLGRILATSERTWKRPWQRERSNPGPMDAREARWWTSAGGSRKRPKRGWLITLESGDFGGTYIIRKGYRGSKGWTPSAGPARDTTVLIQTDHDYPGVANTFGWTMPKGANGCRHDGTDGTVACRSCGMTASRFLESARRFLDGIQDRGVVVEDPGYFLGAHFDL